MDYPVSDPGSQLHNGKFTDGDAAQGIQSSKDKAAHMKAVYDEILNVITAMGLTPDEINNQQLFQALNIYAPWSQITFHYVDLSDPDPVPGWRLCNGSGGTPDMRDRFIVCMGNDYDVGDAAGSDTSTSANGRVTMGNTTLSEAQGAIHGHDLQGQLVAGSGDTEGGSGRYSSSGTDTDVIQPSAGGSGHNHTASVDVRPRYFALAPFMRADYAAHLLSEGGL